MNMTKRETAGFSMIELMIVLVIIAILAAIALPSYRKYVLRGHRTDATRALQDLSSREENYYFSNNAYTNSLAALNASANTQSNDYALSIPSASSTDYTVQAQAEGAQTQDAECTQFSLSRSGVQTSQGSGVATTCWGGGN